MKPIKSYSGVLIKCGDEVLLCKRNETGSLPGEFSIPCGGIEKNEPPLMAAVRELYEETSIEVSSKDLKLIGFINRTNRSGKEYKGLVYVFLYEVDKKVMPDLENSKDAEEHTEGNYYGINDLPSPIGDKLRKIIENILKK
jgi:8-oxo-dGTP pyrophosphatase MutT (NUDIX family)